MKIQTFGFTTTRRFAAIAILASFILSNAFAVETLRGSKVNNPVVSTVTAKYTTDLTKLGREGRIRETLNFETETARLVKVLAEGGVRQPVVVNEDKAVQEQVVEQAALRIAKGNTPAALANGSILKIETDSLFSNARTKEDIASIVNTIVADAAASKGQTILFVNELTNLVGSDAVNNTLFSAIAEGKLVMIGGSSAAAYDERNESQPEIAAYFAGILVAERDANGAMAGNVEQNDSGYRGDNVSPDLREMMANDPSGNTRVDTIIQAKDADSAVLRSLLASGQASVSDRIGNSDTLVVNLPLSAVSALSTSGTINYVSPDRPTTITGHVEDTTGAALMRSQPALNGRSSYTLDGDGIGIAVVDSGIYTSHKGFKENGNSDDNSRIVANVNFTNSNLSDTADLYGHGSHVAGLAAGNSNANSGNYRGVAKKANVISVKVLNNEGVGNTSWLLNGLQWIINNRAAYNIRVVNLSLGTTAVDTYTNDPICVKVKQLAEAGVVVIAAAGNLGKNSLGQKMYGQIHSPGNSPYAITVGASNSLGTAARNDDGMASYSSQGPTRSYYRTSTGTAVYDNLIKPDIVAPGNRLVSYKAANNRMSINNPALNLDSTNGSDSMMYMSGTSMSARSWPERPPYCSRSTQTSPRT
ncbi:MAG: S8 family serine peptidase [Acidobacteria bacterium]|nr:S8 family serine peptidase [Acidobacteriota bacterium]